MDDFTRASTPPTDAQVEHLREINAGLVVNVEDLREERDKAILALKELACDFQTLRNCSPSAKWAAFAGESLERIETLLAKLSGGTPLQGMAGRQPADGEQA